MAKELPSESEPTPSPTKPELDPKRLLQWLKGEIAAGRVELADDKPRTTTRDERILGELD
jgi:hypothetical protein